MRRCLIFDMDGLLFDTEREMLSLLQASLSQRGVEFSRADYRQCIGQAGEDMARFFTSRYGITDVHDMLEEAFDTTHFETVNGAPPLQAGVIELLQTAEQRHLTMAIGTSSSHAVAARFTRAANIYHYFSALVGGDEVTRRKPNPDIYLRVLDLVAMRPEEAVVLEDSDTGVLAAHHAGVRVVQVPDLFPPNAQSVEICYAQYRSLFEVAANLQHILA